MKILKEWICKNNNPITLIENDNGSIIFRTEGRDTSMSFEQFIWMIKDLVSISEKIK